MKQVADEYVVIPRGEVTISFGQTLVFNETGAFLWNLLKNPNDIDHLAEALHEKYSVCLESAKDDVTSFIEKMKDNGLLVEIYE